MVHQSQVDITDVESLDSVKMNVDERETTPQTELEQRATAAEYRVVEVEEELRRAVADLEHVRYLTRLCIFDQSCVQ